MNIIKFYLKSYGLYLRLEYYFISYISYFYNYIKSSNYKKRFKYISNLDWGTPGFASESESYNLSKLLIKGKDPH